MCARVAVCLLIPNVIREGGIRQRLHQSLTRAHAVSTLRDALPSIARGIGPAKDMFKGRRDTMRHQGALAQEWGAPQSRGAPEVEWNPWPRVLEFRRGGRVGAGSQSVNPVLSRPRASEPRALICPPATPLRQAEQPACSTEGSGSPPLRPVPRT